jgi:hypothetical protein
MNSNGTRNTWKWIAGAAAAAVIAAEFIGGALGLGYLFAFLSLTVVGALMVMTVVDWVRDLRYRRNRSFTVPPEHEGDTPSVQRAA